jgi:hypothetical protein
MREGITFVIDTTDDNMMQRQGELQAGNQSTFRCSCRRRIQEMKISSRKRIKRSL